MTTAQNNGHGYVDFFVVDTCIRYEVADGHLTLDTTWNPGAPLTSGQTAGWTFSLLLLDSSSSRAATAARVKSAAAGCAPPAPRSSATLNTIPLQVTTPSQQQVTTPSQQPQSTPTEFIARTSPSIRHPAGLPRCQVPCRRGGHQCPRAARQGFRVCFMHGAGSAKREREGRRKNPKLAPLRHGFRATPETTALLRGAEPDLAADYQRRLAEAGYTRVREDRALAEALLHRFLDGADLSDPDVLDAALSATARITSLKIREERAGRQAGMTSADELLRFLKALRRAVARYVPECDREAFYATVREQSSLRQPA